MQTVYHITDRANLAQIAEQGLLPRSASGKQNFHWAAAEDAVYVFLSEQVARQWSQRCRKQIADQVLVRAQVDPALLHMDSESVIMLIDECGDASLEQKQPWAVELTRLVRAKWDGELELCDLSGCLSASELASDLQQLIRELPAEAHAQLMQIAGHGSWWTESMCIHDGPIISAVEVRSESQDGLTWQPLMQPVAA